MENFGAKEMYDISLRTNSSIEFNGKKYEVNEEVLSFDRAEICQISEIKSRQSANGGFHNNPLIFWENDKQVQFGISNGVLNINSWILLSNSVSKLNCRKSIPYKEIISLIENETASVGQIKYQPNNLFNLGAQENPNLEQLPIGRQMELKLKPLPPKMNKYIFCYDCETGEKIKDFVVYNGNIYLDKKYKKVFLDYTYTHNGDIKTLNIGNQLFKNSLNLTGKIDIKNEKTGLIQTVLIEIPEIRLNSNLVLNLGKTCEYSTVSDFLFTGYPDTNCRRDEQYIFKLTFLDTVLNEEYLE